FGRHFFAFFGRGRQMKRVIPAQAGIRTGRYGNLSGKKVSQVLSPGFPLSWE
ncbi:pilin, partial [Neisseria gonorrhoeae]